MNKRPTTSRPERKALLKCMRLIEKAIEDARAGK